MALTTYSGLQAEVASWLRRTDLSAEIPGFIAMAEAQMNRRLRVWPMIARVTSAISDEYSALPTDLLKVRLFTLDGKPLDYRTPPEMADIAARYPSLGRPAHYSMIGAQFRYAPVPDASYGAELTYWAAIPALTDASPSNWLLAAHPDAYLYGTLLQSAPYLRADERVQTWGSLFGNALTAIEASYREPTGSLRTDLPHHRHRFDIRCG